MSAVPSTLACLVLTNKRRDEVAQDTCAVGKTFAEVSHTLGSSGVDRNLGACP